MPTCTIIRIAASAGLSPVATMFSVYMTRLIAAGRVAARSTTLLHRANVRNLEIMNASPNAIMSDGVARLTRLWFCGWKRRHAIDGYRRAAC
jgi:hypothetical protein